jgi:hypothetical protein
LHSLVSTFAKAPFYFKPALLALGNLQTYKVIVIKKLEPLKCIIHECVSPHSHVWKWKFLAFIKTIIKLPFSDFLQNRQGNFMYIIISEGLKIKLSRAYKIMIVGKNY